MSFNCESNIYHLLVEIVQVACPPSLACSLRRGGRVQAVQIGQIVESVKVVEVVNSSIGQFVKSLIRHWGNS